MSGGLASIFCRRLISSAAALNVLEPPPPPSHLPLGPIIGDRFAPLSLLPLSAFRHGHIPVRSSQPPLSLLSSTGGLSAFRHLVSLLSSTGGGLSAFRHLVHAGAGAAPSTTTTTQDTPVLVLIVWDWENNGLKDKEIDDCVGWIKRNLSDAGLNLDDVILKICVANDFADPGTINHFKRVGQDMIKGELDADGVIVEMVAEFRKGEGKEGNVILLSGDYRLAMRVQACIGRNWNLYIGARLGNLATLYFNDVNPTLVWEWPYMGVRVGPAMTKLQARKKQQQLQLQRQQKKQHQPQRQQKKQQQHQPQQKKQKK